MSYVMQSQILPMAMVREALGTVLYPGVLERGQRETEKGIGNSCPHSPVPGSGWPSPSLYTSV